MSLVILFLMAICGGTRPGTVGVRVSVCVL